MIFNKKKKTVIAYLHTHWDREWYREFEVFRLRLLRVFDNVLNMLENDIIPSFYFDGQVCALLDYLEIRPEKEPLIRDLISRKKLFIGPFYCLVDEFLTDGICFRKNLEIGLKIAKDFGCNDFIGYFADTFGHSQNISHILAEYNIDKAVVWRGVPQDTPAEFIFNGVNTVNLVRGYFMDIFSTDKSIDEKAKFLEDNLDRIAQKSGDILLLPIGADHLGVPQDICDQLNSINNILKNYEIRLGSPFEYFDKVKFKKSITGELRDNSATFILPGSYSARTKLKQLNTEASYKLDLANKVQFNFGNNYKNSIDYAYKLLLQNQAHDSICGCSTDMVHSECITRYNKILQIANAIIEEIRLNQPQNLSLTFSHLNKYKLLEVKRTTPDTNSQILSIENGFSAKILYDVNKIPVTEDYTKIYTILKEFNTSEVDTDLKVTNSSIENSNIKLEVSNGQINLIDGENIYNNFIEFVRYNDLGDTYNHGIKQNDTPEIAQIKSARIVTDDRLRCEIRIETSFFACNVFLNKKSKLLNFQIKWCNIFTNKLWQVRFNLKNKIYETYSEDLNLLIKREFNPDYNPADNLPDTKGKEVQTNTAPMQRFVWANGLGVITKGLQEYEVSENHLSITLLRSVGVISKPDNPSRTTPAGPPIPVIGAQQLGENSAEFAIGFFEVKDWVSFVEEIYPQTIIF